MKKKIKKNEQKGKKKLVIHRETLRALEEGKLADVAGGATKCPTGCSLC